MIYNSTYARRFGLRLVERDDGSAGIEFAVLIAIVVVALLAISFETSQQANGVFHRIGRSFGLKSVVSSNLGQNDAAPTDALTLHEAKSNVYDLASVALLIAAVSGWLIASRLQTRTCNSHKSRGEIHETVETDVVGASRTRFADKRAQILGMMISDNHKLLPSDLKVCDLMTTEIKSALPTATAKELRTRIAEHNVRHILICNSCGELVGIVSDRDLKNVSDEISANAVMVDCPTTVSSDSLVNNAISLLLYGHFSSLPVVDAGRLVGILTTTDVVMTLQCTMLAVEQMVRNLAANRQIDVKRSLEVVGEPR